MEKTGVCRCTFRPLSLQLLWKTGGSVISGSYAWSFQYVLRPSDVVGIPDNANIFLSFFPERKKWEVRSRPAFPTTLRSTPHASSWAPFLTYLRSQNCYSAVCTRIISSSLLHHLHSRPAVGMFLGVGSYIYFPHAHVDSLWFILNERHYFQFDLLVWTIHEDVSENFSLKQTNARMTSFHLYYILQTTWDYQHYK